MIEITNPPTGGQKKDFIFILIAVLLLILTSFAILNFSSVKSRFQKQVSKIIGKAVLKIDFGNGTKRAFEGEIIENETLVGVLIQASRAGNFSYKLDEMASITSLEDTSGVKKNFISDKNKSWQWYLNDKKINKLPGEIIVGVGDNILIRYE